MKYSRITNLVVILCSAQLESSVPSQSCWVRPVSETPSLLNSCYYAWFWTSSCLYMSAPLYFTRTPPLYTVVIPPLMSESMHHSVSLPSPFFFSLYKTLIPLDGGMCSFSWKLSRLRTNAPEHWRMPAGSVCEADSKSRNLNIVQANGFSQLRLRWWRRALLGHEYHHGADVVLLSSVPLIEREVLPNFLSKRSVEVRINAGSLCRAHNLHSD